ncbi:MAG: flagella protein [Methanobacteriota archaeon]|nr:MAG: flagella protein [Euryarchaeota archaeon]
MAGLFRKKPTKDDSSSRRKLKDFEEDAEEEVYDEFQTDGGSDEEYPPLGEEDELIRTDDMDDTSVSGVREFSEILGRLEEIEDKIGRIDSALTTVKNEGSKDRERLNIMEQDIRKLLSVYEIVSAKINPFIDVSDRDSPEAEARAPAELEFSESGLDEDLPEFRPFGEGDDEESFERRGTSKTDRDASPWEPETPTEPDGAARAQPRMMPQQDRRERSKADERDEREVRAAARSKHNKKPLLAYVCHDYLTLVLVMRWIEFMFERVPRDRISLVLDYYVDVGWISEDVKSEIMSYARGEMQDVNKYMEYEEAREEVFKDLPTPESATYKKVEDWRLTADDHLKSLLFIQKIAGFEIDKDRLNSLEQNISKFKESLEGFHGV